MVNQSLFIIRFLLFRQLFALGTNSAPQCLLVYASIQMTSTYNQYIVVNPFHFRYRKTMMDGNKDLVQQFQNGLHSHTLTDSLFYERHLKNWSTLPVDSEALKWIQFYSENIVILFNCWYLERADANGYGYEWVIYIQKEPAYGLKWDYQTWDLYIIEISRIIQSLYFRPSLITMQQHWKKL